MVLSFPLTNFLFHSVVVFFFPGRAQALLCCEDSLRGTIHLLTEFPSVECERQIVRLCGLGEAQLPCELRLQAHPLTLFNFLCFPASLCAAAKMSRNLVLWKEFYFSLAVWQDKFEREATSKKEAATTGRHPQYG